MRLGNNAQYPGAVRGNASCVKLARASLRFPHPLVVLQIVTALIEKIGNELTISKSVDRVWTVDTVIDAGEFPRPECILNEEAAAGVARGKVCFVYPEAVIESGGKKIALLWRARSNARYNIGAPALDSGRSSP